MITDISIGNFPILQSVTTRENNRFQILKLLLPLGGNDQIKTENKPENRDAQLASQREHGIFFDDEYDYMQHLRERGQSDIVWEASNPTKPGKFWIPTFQNLEPISPTFPSFAKVTYMLRDVTKCFTNY